MHSIITKFSLLGLCAMATLTASSQTRSNKNNGGYQFTIETEVVVSDVKNQFKSSTCWVFSTESFLESEMVRMGTPPVDLSEMFVVKNGYAMKAQNYVRMQGHAQFAPGGEPHDVMTVLKEKGMVPQEAYAGYYPGMDKPQHFEMDAALKGMLDEVVKMPDGKLSPRWQAAFNGALDGYMGVTPDKFTYKGKEYTPKSFGASLGINPDDYVEITSFMHHPFYEQFVLEVPDNWNWGPVYNVPLNELEAIADHALKNNYSIAWASDVSEKGFSFKNGLAIVPAKNWEDMSQTEKDSVFAAPMTEKTITQELRQAAFDDQSTQDDHGMHIIGLAKDQTGKKFYLVKNSWGTDGNDLKGYFYCSAPYFQYKTTCIMVHKNAIPEAIAKKLKLK